ncbi:MAG: EAL domain-containing protein [Candidatus Melainabacteria bacterium]|nr:EAL domain-containing protein [Candidatus Melainabacteria bacterium]
MGRFNFKTVLAFTAALAIVWVWFVFCVPAIFPLGKSLETWLEQRVSIFQELQLTQEALRDVELNHHTYIITGDQHQLDAFHGAAESVRHHMMVLNSMRQSDSVFGEKNRNLSGRVGILMDELKQSAEVRQKQGKPQADHLVVKSGENRELREVVRQIVRMQEDEFEAVKNKAAEYNHMIGPYPWIVVLMVLGGAGVLILRTMGGKNDSDSATTIKNLTTELNTTKEQLERLSRTDMLTEVLNLRGLEKVISVEENKITRSGGHMIAVLVNCDNFKRINESLGMATGDVILKDVARRVLATLRPSDHVARVDGNDEFIVILPDTQLAYGLRVAERIRTAVSEHPLHSLQEVEPVTVSLGVAMLPHGVSSVQEIISLTRGALRRSKQTGKNKVSLAREGGGADASINTSNEETIQTLLDISNFRTVYQPIIDLATEQVAGFEIFTRGPDGAFENPADLFRSCIENNILTNVDMNCLRLCVEMSADIAENMRVHVNLFPSTILDTPIETLIAAFPKDKGRVYCVEISEQQFIGDPSFMREHVQKLRSAGVLVAIDDIGFGRNSLETLIFLEPDVVKVDRTYVTGISEDKGKVRLLKRLTNVAKSLGAEVVAEGVERREDLPILQDLGIHFAQGFLWGELLQVLPSSAKDQRTLSK